MPSYCLPFAILMHLFSYFIFTLLKDWTIACCAKLAIKVGCYGVASLGVRRTLSFIHILCVSEHCAKTQINLLNFQWRSLQSQFRPRIGVAHLGHTEFRCICFFSLPFFVMSESRVLLYFFFSRIMQWQRKHSTLKVSLCSRLCISA